jgi:hypothetical protein
MGLSAARRRSGPTRHCAGKGSGDRPGKRVPGRTPGPPLGPPPPSHFSIRHGHPAAVIERIGPWRERRFGVGAPVTHTPFALRPGAACRAELVVGRKQVYRLILEQ